MSGTVLLQVPEGALRSSVPKHGMTLEEVVASYGPKSLVVELRGIGALMPAGKAKQSLVFDAAHVAQVWAEFCSGKYDAQLANWRSMLPR